MLPIEHIHDKNFHQVGSHLMNQHSAQTQRHMARVVACNAKDYQVSVQLLGMVDSRLKPVVLHNVQVGVEHAGNGWGEHNLPYPGQMVEVVFDGGITTSSDRAYVGKRYYNNSTKPPQHPLLNGAGYVRGRYQASEGGTYEFRHADGQVTKYHPQPQNQEGSKSNTRATGVAKTATEARMDASAGKAAAATRNLETVANTGVILTGLVAETTALTKLKTHPAVASANPSPPVYPEWFTVTGATQWTVNVDLATQGMDPDEDRKAFVAPYEDSLKNAGYMMVASGFEGAGATAAWFFTSYTGYSENALGALLTSAGLLAEAFSLT